MIRPYYSKKLQTMTYNVDNEWRIPDRLRPSARLLGGEDRAKGAVFTVKNEYRRLCILAGGNPGAGGKPQEWGFCRPCWQRHCRICGIKVEEVA